MFYVPSDTQLREQEMVPFQSFASKFIGIVEDAIDVASSPKKKKRKRKKKTRFSPVMLGEECCFFIFKIHWGFCLHIYIHHALHNVVLLFVSPVVLVVVDVPHTIGQWRNTRRGTEKQTTENRKQKTEKVRKRAMANIKTILRVITQQIFRHSRNICRPAVLLRTKSGRESRVL